MPTIVAVLHVPGSGPSRAADYQVSHDDGKHIYFGSDREYAIRLYRKYGGTDEAAIEAATREAEADHRRHR